MFLIVVIFVISTYSQGQIVNNLIAKPDKLEITILQDFIDSAKQFNSWVMKSTENVSNGKANQIQKINNLILSEQKQYQDFTKEQRQLEEKQSILYQTEEDLSNQQVYRFLKYLYFRFQRAPIQIDTNENDLLFFEHLSSSADLLKELNESSEICEKGKADNAISRLKIYTDVFEKRGAKLSDISKEQNCDKLKSGIVSLKSEIEKEAINYANSKILIEKQQDRVKLTNERSKEQLKIQLDANKQQQENLDRQIKLLGYKNNEELSILEGYEQLQNNLMDYYQSQEDILESLSIEGEKWQMIFTEIAVVMERQLELIQQ